MTMNSNFVESTVVTFNTPPVDPHLLDVIRRHFLRRPIEGRQSKEENYTAMQLRGQVGQVPVIDALLRLQPKNIADTKYVLFVP